MHSKRQVSDEVVKMGMDSAECMKLRAKILPCMKRLDGKLVTLKGAGARCCSLADCRGVGRCCRGRCCRGAAER